MIPVQEVMRSVYAAARLARLDASAINLFEDSRQGALNSFFAAVLLAPVFLVMLAVDVATDPPAIDAARLLIIKCLAYVMGWAAFPAVMSFLVTPLDREHRYFRLVAAYNWSSVIQVAILIPLELVSRLEILPGLMSDTLVLVAGIAVLAYVWYVVKTALEIGGGMAAMLIFGDFLMAMVILGWSDSLIGG